jgi:hypothetical protein
VADWINQVYAQACIELEANVTTSTATLTAGTASYNLTTLFPSLVRLKEWYITPVGAAQSVPIQQTTLDYILTHRQSSGGVSASRGYVTHYALVGTNQLEFYPTPTSNDTVTAWYVALPTALSASSDTPILAEPYASKLLEYGALAEAADWKGDPSEQEYRALFQLWMQKYRAHLTRRAGGQPGQFRVFGLYNFPPHDPSTDRGN